MRVGKGGSSQQGKERMQGESNKINASLPKTLAQCTENGEIKLVPPESFHPYVLVSLVQEGIAHAVKRET